jgi:HPt (histidine-containing phosphotransfer) domain-containing protein
MRLAVPGGMEHDAAADGPPDWMREDPELAELLAQFVARLPERAQELEARLASGDRDGLRSIAHQLKGTAGAYGFARVGDAAAALEACSAPGASLDAVRDAVARVVELCRAAHAASR